MSERRWDIEAAKGLAILLVVFGHLVARADPAHVDWYEPLRRAVYAFHMPFFLYLSGLVAAHSGFLRRGRAALWLLARRRAKRLLLPFFAMGLLILVAKCAMAPFFYVDNTPPSFVLGLRALVWDTAHSPALSIWYLFVLFVVSMASLVLLDGRPARLPWLAAGTLLLFWLPLPAFCYIDRVAMFAPFFVLGAWAGEAGRRWEAVMDRVWPVALTLFCVALLAVILFDKQWATEEKFILLPVGVISLPSLHGLLRTMRPGALRKFFLLLGRYSFMIYLFNTIFIGAMKALLLVFCSWNGAAFLPFAAALMCAGLCGPMALKHYAMRHVKALDRLTD